MRLPGHPPPAGPLGGPCQRGHRRESLPKEAGPQPRVGNSALLALSPGPCRSPCHLQHHLPLEAPPAHREQAEPPQDHMRRGVRSGSFQETWLLGFPHQNPGDHRRGLISWPGTRGTHISGSRRTGVSRALAVCSWSQGRVGTRGGSRVPWCRVLRRHRALGPAH